MLNLIIWLGKWSIKCDPSAPNVCVCIGGNSFCKQNYFQIKSNVCTGKYVNGTDGSPKGFGVCVGGGKTFFKNVEFH